MTTTIPGTIEQIDPTTLVIGANVRLVPELDDHDKQFVASIRERGVLVPIVARRDEHGNVIVRMGQRRTLAARLTGTPQVPVYVLDGDESTADRIIEQMAENDHRKDLTDGERAAAFEQLAFEGLSVTQIAKKTAHKPATVKQGLAVAKNSMAAAAIDSHALTLDQAAALIEFEGDDDTVADLIEVATNSPEQFEYQAQRVRDDRKRAALVAEATATLTEQGFTVLDREPGYYDTEWTPIRDLATKDGERITEELVASIEGRCAHVRAYATGAVQITYWVHDFKKAGLRKLNSSGTVTGPMTDEQKAERRELIANNKAWVAAETVRREWLTGFLTRKSLPKDAAAFVAQGVTSHRHDLSTSLQQGNSLAHTLLGIESAGYWGADRLAALVETTPTKALHVALAVVLGGIEAGTSKATWRNPSKQKAAYFRQIAAWGYPLTDVEKIVADSDTTTETDTIEDDTADLDAED